MATRDLDNPYALSRFLASRGVPVSQRTVAYLLDPRDDRSPNLSTVIFVAAGFGCQPWQLLVPGFDPLDPPRVEEPSARRRARTPTTL